MAQACGQAGQAAHSACSSAVLRQPAGCSRAHSCACLPCPALRYPPCALCPTHWPATLPCAAFSRQTNVSAADLLKLNPGRTGVKPGAVLRLACYPVDNDPLAAFLLTPRYFGGDVAYLRVRGRGGPATGWVGLGGCGGQAVAEANIAPGRAALRPCAVRLPARMHPPHPLPTPPCPPAVCWGQPAARATGAGWRHGGVRRE